MHSHPRTKVVGNRLRILPYVAAVVGISTAVVLAVAGLVLLLTGCAGG